MKPIYTILGEVLPGAKRGKTFGYPTANIKLDQDIPDGIYASMVIISDVIPAKAGIQEDGSPIKSGMTYIAATFIGAAEMFGEKEKKAESYILNFDADIYGKTLTVDLYKKIRDNQKFDSENALIEQMEKDVKEVKEFFK